MDEENEMTLLASEVVDDANWEVWHTVHYSCYWYLKNKEFRFVKVAIMVYKIKSGHGR